MEKLKADKKEAMNEVCKLRDKIDEIDDKIVTLLEKRFEISQELGKIKQESDIPIYDASREREIIERLSKNSKIKREIIENIFKEIICSSRSLQRKLKIAYLGPKASFTHMAAIKEFGKMVDFQAKDSIAEVFEAVEKNTADFGVVPVENSTEGTVNHTLDMFMESNLSIVGEISMPIVHNLLSNYNLDEIKKVYSHQQAFAQCRKWLSKNLPKAELVEVSSTTKGAECATIYHSSAAIASKIAAEEYELKIVAEDISDTTKNYTRFLVIGKENNNKPTGKDKTSILFSVKHEAGALFRALKPFHDLKINMTKIESRPTKVKNWEYVFFVDVQGFKDDEKIKKALDEMEKCCGFIKILGSYPERAISE